MNTHVKSLIKSGLQQIYDVYHENNNSLEDKYQLYLEESNGIKVSFYYEEPNPTDRLSVTISKNNYSIQLGYDPEIINPLNHEKTLTDIENLIRYHLDLISTISSEKMFYVNNPSDTMPISKFFKDDHIELKTFIRPPYIEQQKINPVYQLSIEQTSPADISTFFSSNQISNNSHAHEITIKGIKQIKSEIL